MTCMDYVFPSSHFQSECVSKSEVGLLKNFSQFVVIHIVKGFHIVSKAEVDVFLEFLSFLYDPTNG